MTALRALNGRYLLRSRNAVADLLPGSVILFRYGEVIVGEAVVRQYDRELPQVERITERTLTGQVQDYEARVLLAPGSIRLFSPPIGVNELQRIVGSSPDLTVPRGYYAIREWSVYPRLLATHITPGGAFV
jgi:hypothetical protein